MDNEACFRRFQCFGKMPFMIFVWLGLLAVSGDALIAKSGKDRAKAVTNFTAIAISNQRVASAPTLANDRSVPAYPWGKCSTEPSKPVVMDSGEPCPPECPFSMMVEGQACEKLCVHASLCGQFHPVLFFADIRTMQCTPSCGAKRNQHIAGCSECLGPGICKRCARGLFGITQLELSDDGLKCVNVTLKWWYAFYSIAALVIAGVIMYVVCMAWRSIEHLRCKAKEVIADNRREEARTELCYDRGSPLYEKRNTLRETTRALEDAMRGNDKSSLQSAIARAKEAYDLLTALQTSTDDGFVHSHFHEMHTASARGGRGVALYFNWLIFGMLVALTLAGGNFVAYELSDLGRHKSEPRSCLVTDPIEDYDDMTMMSSFVARRSVNALVHETQRFSDRVTDWTKPILDAVRASVRVVANEAPPTGSIAERYAQVHKRMFSASITMYIIVMLLVFGFTVFQLGWVSARFENHETHAKSFAAVVTGLPLDLFDGKLLTEFFRQILKKPDEDLRNLWQVHGGTRGEDRYWENVALQDRFWVVGTSIAYDFNLQQDAIGKEIDSWVNDLDMLQSNEPSYAIPDTAIDATSRGMQTETRGNILEQLRDEVPKKDDPYIFDEGLLKFVGLEEERETTLNGSGTAFVIFATEAARDAVVALASTKDFKTFSMPGQDDIPYNLGVAPAPCEPVSVKWENFGPLSNLTPKLLMSILVIFLTMFVWIALSLPSAVFIADLALIPGVRPGFAQNLILGLLIAVGNQLIALVVELVTSWMGFLYKDSRDVAVLGLAFIGTLVATVFDLCVVAMTAHGMVLEDAFHGRDAGYEPVVANELFGLTVPGYLVLPYLGMPIGEHVLPYFLAKFLIRSHAKVTLRSATRAMKSPSFDICWRYSDILNNTTICIVLLFFCSNRAWMTMSVLFLFMVIIYMIDKYLLLRVATPTVYDTHRLSSAFTLWWCLPTTMLACLISHWGYRSGSISSVAVCFAIPIAHALFFVIALLQLESWLMQSDDKEPVLYPDMIRRLQKTRKQWDYFNTNPVFCLRTRCHGAEETGWKEVVRFQQSGSSSYAVQEPNTGSPTSLSSRTLLESDECLPFKLGSLRVLDPMIKEQHYIRKSRQQPVGP